MQIEDVLYDFYRKEQRVEKLNINLKVVDKRILQLRKDLKNCNIEMECTLNSIDYTKERVSNSNVVSQIEMELEKAVNRILEDLRNEIKNRNDITNEINKIRSYTKYIEAIIENLNDEEGKIIRFKYCDKLSLHKIAEKLNYSPAKIFRQNKNIIRNLNETIYKIN